MQNGLNVQKSASQPLRVVDVGAGTGKLTLVLVSLGHQVTAVDPDPGMLAVLSERMPDIRVLVGSAEHIPLPDLSVDAVVIAQAFHWVDRAAAYPEIARVLRPGGSLGVVWNHREETSRWMQELSRLWGGSAGRLGATFNHVVEGHQLFGPLANFNVENHQLLTAEELIALTSSRSYVIALDKDHREELVEQVRELARGYQTETGESRFPVIYQTTCYRMQKI